MSHGPLEDERQRFMRTKVLPFYTSMGRLLALMVGDGGRERWKRGGTLCQCVFNHPGFEIRVACRDKRIRPFLAHMDRPSSRSAYLGRLMPDGTVHVFDHGMKVFFDQLMQEGVLDQFTTALTDTVQRYEALDRQAAEKRAASESTKQDGHARESAGPEPDTAH